MYHATKHSTSMKIAICPWSIYTHIYCNLIATPPHTKCRNYPHASTENSELRNQGVFRKLKYLYDIEYLYLYTVIWSDIIYILLNYGCQTQNWVKLISDQMHEWNFGFWTLYLNARYRDVLAEIYFVTVPTHVWVCVWMWYRFNKCQLGQYV